MHVLPCFLVCLFFAEVRSKAFPLLKYAIMRPCILLLYCFHIISHNCRSHFLLRSTGITHIPHVVKYVQLVFACMQMCSMHKCEREACSTASDWLENHNITVCLDGNDIFRSVEMQTHKVVGKKLNWRELKNFSRAYFSDALIRAPERFVHLQ